MKMKNIVLKLAAFAALIAGVTACGYDNFDAPESTLQGSVQYNGSNVPVKGTGGTIQLQLYQPGYELTSPITVYVDQDGNFSAKLFNGSYKLVTRDNNGPWLNTRDTVDVTVNGNTSVIVNVTPYYVISSPEATLSGTSGSVSFNVEQVVSSTSVSYGRILIGHTSMLDEQNNDASFEIPVEYIQTGSNTIPVTLTSDQATSLQTIYSKYNKITLRISIRSADAPESNYSEMIDLSM
jgi:hypothetical protein